MRSKAPLALIEQAAMLLVFALAAVLCLRAFVWADAASKDSAARDQALVRAQSAAETLKAAGGDYEAAARLCGGVWDGQTWLVLYDEQWAVTEDMHTYTLSVSPGTGDSPLLGTAEVRVLAGETCLAALDVAWQEVTRHGP